MTTEKTFDRAMRPFVFADRPNGKPYTARTLRRKMIRLWYCTQSEIEIPPRKNRLLTLRRLPLHKVLSTKRTYF